jgi:hypothetical protein
MENINKGDSVLNTKTNTEYVVESVETYGNTTVVFTEGDKCTCLPISEIIKTPKSWLSNFISKKLNKFYVSDIEEKKFDECLSKLKLVTIKPYYPGEIDQWINDLK